MQFFLRPLLTWKSFRKKNTRCIFLNILREYVCFNWFFFTYMRQIGNNFFFWANWNAIKWKWNILLSQENNGLRNSETIVNVTQYSTYIFYTLVCLLLYLFRIVLNSITFSWVYGNVSIVQQKWHPTPRKFFFRFPWSTYFLSILLYFSVKINPT